MKVLAPFFALFLLMGCVPQANAPASVGNAALTSAERLSLRFTGADLELHPEVVAAFETDGGVRQFEDIIQTLAQREIRWLVGDRDARVVLKVNQFELSQTPRATITVNPSRMSGTVALFDMETGEQIGQTAPISVTGSNYVPDQVVDSLATENRSSEIADVSLDFVRRARLAILGG